MLLTLWKYITKKMQAVRVFKRQPAHKVMRFGAGSGGDRKAYLAATRKNRASASANGSQVSR